MNPSSPGGAVQIALTLIAFLMAALFFQIGKPSEWAQFPPGKQYSFVAGTLRQDPEFDDWWHGEALAFPFWDGRSLPVVYEFDPQEDPRFVVEADAALKRFLRKSREDRLALAPELERSCRRCWEAVDYCGTVLGLSNEELETRWLGKENGNTPWNYVAFPEEVHVRRRDRRDREIYVSMSLRCEWQEVGLLMVFRKGSQLTRLSGNDGWLTEADAFGKDDSEDELLSRYSGE